MGAKVTTVATGTDASAVAPVEPADPEDFPAFHPRAPDAYISFNSVNRLLERGDVALVRSEFFLDRDSPIPARQNLDSTFVFGGPLELKLRKSDTGCDVGLMTVVAISYTWNQTWRDGKAARSSPGSDDVLSGDRAAHDTIHARDMGIQRQASVPVLGESAVLLSQKLGALE